MSIYYPVTLFKKPYIFYQDPKDGSEEKPKRKLPDPEKFSKKSTPPASHSNQVLPPAVNSRHSHSGEAPDSSETSTPIPVVAPGAGMPPIQSSGPPSLSRWVGEKTVWAGSSGVITSIKSKNIRSCVYVCMSQSLYSTVRLHKCWNQAGP